MKVFLDTAPLIYLIEGKKDYQDRVEVQLKQWLDTNFSLATSSLTVLELLVVPKKQGDERMVRKYRALLENLVTEPLIPLDTEIAETAAAIRGEYGFRTADAVQLGTALHCGADIFYTNDLRLKSFSDLTILTVHGE